ncbi:MAG: DNA-directed RNA polymerase subunit omega [Alphaproteobacteria bacterium]|nr:DNA-directed RNA polymerase subunit omega [Alphaproteobacteria bacterium]
MARVTVEDCVERIPNRFELVMLASQRAREIGAGSAPLVSTDRDKNPVLALRELAEDKVYKDTLEEELIRSHQRIIEMDDDEEVIDLMDEEEEGWDAIAAERNAADMDDVDDLDGDDDDLDMSLEMLAGENAED